VRQLAWLNAAPHREGDKSRPVSRLQRMRTDRADPRYMPEMPDPGGAAYLLAYLFELGPASSTGMGTAPITHHELAAWRDLTGTPLQPWEARFLRALSREYVAEAAAAEDPMRPAPWSTQPSTEQLHVVARSLRDEIAAMAAD